MKIETLAEFLARGGEIQRCPSPDGPVDPSKVEAPETRTPNGNRRAPPPPQAEPPERDMTTREIPPAKEKTRPAKKETTSRGPEPTDKPVRLSAQDKLLLVFLCDVGPSPRAALGACLERYNARPLQHPQASATVVLTRLAKKGLVVSSGGRPSTWSATDAGVHLVRAMGLDKEDGDVEDAQ